MFGVEPSLRLEGERTCDRLVMSALVLVPRRDKMMGLNDSQPTHESRGRKGTKAQSTHTAGPREGDGPFGVTSPRAVPGREQSCPQESFSTGLVPPYENRKMTRAFSQNTEQK